MEIKNDLDTISCYNLSLKSSDFKIFNGEIIF